MFLNGQTLFDGGAGIPLHVHNCPESVVVILEGNAIVEIDGQEHALTTFDTTYVDAGVPLRFRNASDLRLDRRDAHDRGDRRDHARRDAEHARG